MHAFSESGLWLLFDVSVKALLLAGVAAVVLRCLRRVDANLRHRVWTAVLAAMLLLPAMMAITPSLSLSLPVALSRANDRPQSPEIRHEPQRPVVAESAPLDRTARFDLPESPANSEPPRAALSTEVTETARQKAARPRPAASMLSRPGSIAQRLAAVPWAMVVVCLYLTGVLLLSMRLVLGYWATRRLRQLVVPISQPLDVRAQVVSSTAVRVPVTLGGMHPCIVLPADWSEWNAGLLHSVLAHEQAHLDRRDHVVQWLSEINRCLFWFHPLAWFLRRHLARLAEQCCDDTVIGSLQNRGQYAKHLLEIAGRLTASPERVAPLGISMARTSEVEIRIEAILDAHRPLARQIGRRNALMILAVAIPLVMLTAALRAEDPQESGSRRIQSVELTATQRSDSEPKSGSGGGLRESPSQSKETSVEPSPEPAGPGDTGAMDPIRIKGRVVDAEGKPVASADVSLPLRMWAEAGWSLVTKTESDGRFALDVPRSMTAPGDFIPLFTVWAYSPHHQLGTVRAYQQLFNGDKSELEIKLDPQTDTAFRVLDPDGNPVPGAIVEPWHVKTPVAYEIPPVDLRPKLSGTTAEDGRARLPAVGREELYTIAIRAERYGEQRLQLVNSADEPAERRVYLRQAMPVVIHVTAEEPKHCRGLRVAVTSVAEREGPHPLTEGSGIGHTDENGLLSISSLAEGRLQVIVLVDPELPLRPQIPSAVELSEAGPKNVEVPLVSATRVRGSVREKESGVGIPDVLVSVQYGETANGARPQNNLVRSDASGKFETFVLPGNVRQQAIMLPAGRLQVGESWDERHAVSGSDGPVELPPLELVKTQEIHGRLIDARGEALVDLEVNGISGDHRYGFEVRAVADSIRRGRPYGSETWQHKVAKQLHLESTFRPRGRPKKEPAGEPRHSNKGSRPSRPL